jgi:diguanylate cyclase (GGDEF)-like protein
MTGVAVVTERGRTGRVTILDRLARMAHGADADMAFEPRRHRLLVLSLFSSPAAMIMSNVIGALIPLFCWYAAQDPEFVAVAITTALVVSGRIALAIHYSRIRAQPLSDRQIAWLDRSFFAGATAFSLCLGVSCYLALANTDSIPCHILTIVCAIAYSAGYVARNAGRPFFVIVQLLCFCSPMIVGLVAATDPLYAWVAVFIGFFILTNVVIAFSLNRNLLALDAAQRRSESLAASLRTKNVTLDTALNSMTHGLALFGRDLDLEISNLRFADLLRLAGPDLATGNRLTALLDRLIVNQILSPNAARDIGQCCRRALRTGGTSAVEIQTEIDQVLLVTADGGILLLVEDFSERKAAAAQIERMAHTDNLTGLPNRFRITQLLRQACEGADARPGETALLYIDLDNFKAVNDSLGHEAGDQLLVEVAARLRSVLDAGQVIARIGGDEFLLLAPGLDEAAALALGGRVVAAMQTPFKLRGALLPVTTSVGVALAPRHGRDPSDALRAADMALYEAKNDGRNRVVLFRETIAAAVQSRRELELDLHEACRTGNLFLAYQPIVDLTDRGTNSFEALMRWRHPTKGLVPPSDFIPIAEQTGLIATMGDWAIRRACMDAAGWPSAASVAVNLSAVQFREPQRLVQSVKDALLISRLPPERLELEVTESLLIEDQDAAMEAIRALRRIGVRFSLDDFGIGYSSLAYLARYPFSKVKIDRSFAEHVTSDPTSRTIIEMICQMADRLSMAVVVEGIETEEQLAAIVALGAGQGQGWLFGRPAPNESLMADRHAA